MGRFRITPKLFGAAVVCAAAALLLQQSNRRRSPHANGGSARCRVVVVGAGFGGLQVALELAERAEVDLTIIDARNHHLFQPLLYQVATAALSPTDIATPLRNLLPISHRVRLLMDEVTGVNVQARRVLCQSGQSVPYDELVLATGSRPSYFGHPDWAKLAPGMKSLDDALRLRNMILSALERAAETRDDDLRDRMLTFLLVGAGPTGVEMAGSLAELARAFPAEGLGPVRIILVDAGSRVLPEFAPDLSTYTAHALRALGVEVRTGKRVAAVKEGEVELEGETVQAGTIIWAAGTEATPVAAWLGVTPEHGGRVRVDAWLRIPGRSCISVIGDAAFTKGSNGKPLPALASVAKQQGLYVARSITRRVRGQSTMARFRYRDYGTLATIGRNQAVAELGTVHLTGRAAWLMWATAHIVFLISFRNRLLVSFEWLLAYLSDRRGAGLIVRPEPLPPQPPVEKPG